MLMGRPALIALFATLLRSGASHFCEPQCENRCDQLNGNVTFECGGCDSASRCWPGALEFSAMRTDPPVKESPPEAVPAAAAVAVQRSYEVPREAKETVCESEAYKALPALQRYCRRGASCARVDAAIAWHLEHVQSASGSTDIVRAEAAAGAPIIHRERPSVGAGFAHVLQEQANALLLALVLGRPVLFASEGAVYNAAGALLGPAPPLANVVYPSSSATPPGTRRGWATFLGCRARLVRLRRQGRLLLPYRCKRWTDGAGGDDGALASSTDSEGANIDVSGQGGDGGALAAPDDSGHRGEWVLSLEDGDAWKVVNLLKSRWNRFTHVTRPGRLDEYVPAEPMLFSSPSVFCMYLSDFLLADGSLDVRKANTRASVGELTGGHSDLSGPSCLLRRLIDTASTKVLSLVARALEPAANALIVGLHIRRGDAAMQQECSECVNGDDPDVVAQQVRVTLEQLDRELVCANQSMAALRTAFGGSRRIVAFAASDTQHGMQRAVSILGRENVLFLEGTAVHSTRPSASSASLGAAARKVAADFLALAIADIHFGIGDSSFLGNAAAASMGNADRISSRVPSGTTCRQFEPREVARLLEATARLDDTDRSRSVQHARTAPLAHVEL